MNIKKITFSALIVSFGLLIGRLSGFLRDIVIANNFGANEKSDFIVILLTTPDFIVNILMGGALSMALIPEFKRLNKEQADLLYKQVSSLLFLFGFTLAIISYFYKGELVKFLALGMGEVFINKNENYFFYSLLALPFSFATGASLAYLNAKERFTVTSLGTIIVNLTIIMFISISAYLEGDFFYISIGLVLAAILRWLSQIVSINIFPFLLFIKTHLLISTELVKRYCYALFSGTIIFFLPVVVRTIASIEGEGVLSLVNYSIKLVDLPLIILSSTFSLIMLPLLSGKHASGDENGFVMAAKLVVTLVIVISLLVLIPLNVHSNLAVQAVYSWGSLSSLQNDIIAKYLSIYSFSLPFQCVNIIILAIFSARRDTKTPFYITTGLGLLLFGYLLLIKPSVEQLMWSLVVFYFFMSLMFIITMKLIHGFLLLGGRRWFIFRSAILLSLTFLCMTFTKEFILTLSPLLAIFIVVFFVAGTFLLVLWNFKREIIIGYN